MYKNKTQRNRPAAALIREYTERVKGKMSIARDELHRRFDSLDYNQQKKILIAHLKGSRSDRHWAYPRLLDYWDNSFIAPVLQAWDEYHEPRCSWAIIRYFPKEYIMQHFDELAAIERNYYHICLRFGADSDFEIDRKLLEPLDFLCVMFRSRRFVESGQALRCFYEIAGQTCRTAHIFPLALDLKPHDPRTEKLQPLMISDIRLAFYYIAKMDIYPATTVLSDWMDRITAEIQASKEWSRIRKRPLSDYQFKLQAIHILTSAIENNIPSQYAH